ncbi:MAG: glutamine--tRNA ligase/YqeY domain fusion protein [Candidatus Ventricola sp.]|nr:glutamine--tRNA ligase/YqeY domain fusion protein [Clostridiales bacterium]MDY4854855.1 glutamine--tRNA ligase/YqeY domain fusion protein [Candidatus Ventricola sp.]
MAEEIKEKSNFIWEAIKSDLAEGKNGGRVQTRFPPEPNGYLHIGHVKALTVDFATAEKFGGVCNLRFDDTNPTKEKEEFVEAIKDDIHWLGFEYGAVYYASEQYDQIFEYACDLIRRGLAYVDDLSKEEMRAYRGTLKEPGKNSPYRDRTPEENMDLFLRMKNGEFPEGSRTLRAKIDMASPNINLRDPAIYRIKYATHHRTGDKWCIYPMYDFAHPIGDALEGVTHSLCSLEYEIHRPLYDWVVNVCGFEQKPRQIEFARLNLTNTVMSKRKLRKLVEEHHVAGWDDPRMPTLAGMRRRGYTSAAVRDFIDRIGVSKADSTVDHRLLEYCVRNDLGEVAPRAMAVLDPVKVVLTNIPEGTVELCEIENHPKKPEMGTHQIPLTREIYIEREDFMIDAPKKYFRLKPDGEVRLKGAYIIKCERYDVDEAGNVTCIYCTVDPTSKSGSEGADRKVKGTIHWVSAEQNVPLTARLYDVLILDEKPEEAPAEAAEDEDAEEAAASDDFLRQVNPDSLKVVNGYGEPWLAEAKVGDSFQFLRTAYFCKDKDSTDEKAVFNRVVTLKDSFKLD